MADFIDSEASESDTEETPKSKKKIPMIDSDDDEEEEDDEEKIAEEMKDLINDDDEEEEGEASDRGGGSGSDREEHHKRKHRDSDLDDQLEDDDYDLIEENLGIKVKRQPKKLKRIRMLSDDEDSGKEEEGDDREQIANELFEGDDDEGAQDGEEPAQRQEEDIDIDEEEESDVDDFIVDEEGQPISKRGKKKHKVIHADKALQQAQDIFGVDFDFEEFDRYEDYDDESELEDEEDEEGEELDEEGERRKKRKQARKLKKKSIFDVYEPSELERGHFTDRDNEIRENDIPERFQLRRVPVKPADKNELEEESDWIYRQAFASNSLSLQDEDDDVGGRYSTQSRKGPKTSEKIREALNCMRNQQFEVPFIAFYRKEYVEPELNINDLWKVWQWDEKWTLLRQRKQRMIELFEKMQTWQFDQYSDTDKPLDSGIRALTEEDIDRIRISQTMEELNDLHQHFLLYYGRDVPKMRIGVRNKRREEEGRVPAEEVDEHDDIPKQASRKSGYTLCVQSGLAEFSKKFGLTVEQFGENLRDNYQRHDIEQFSVEPLDYAKELVSDRFPTPEEVLNGARHMVAMQIAHDPTVHAAVRIVYYERAKLTVRPTVKGMKEIDESHMGYTIKYLKNKPIKDIRYDQFLKLVLAEEENLLIVTLSLDDGGPGSQTYFDEVKSLYHLNEFSKLVQEWNDQRSSALERAFNKILYPQLAKELRAKLLQEAKDHVIKSSCHKLYNWLKIAPYQPEQQLEDDEDYMENTKGLKVLGIAFSPERDVPAFCSIVDGDGEVLDFCRLPNLLRRRNSLYEDERNRKQGDMDKLKKFITKKKPHVIVVGADCREAIGVVEDVKRCVQELEEEQQIPSIGVELMDNELAVLYSNTKRSSAEFREYPPLLRQAVSLARRIQDPLIEFCQLCNADEDIMSLKYHPLQEKVNRDELMDALHLEFVNRVNEVGVDVNKCISHAHLAPQIQFICGLGPRKGYHCLKLIKQIGRLENRGGLVTACNMGPKIFINCAGFIKIDTNMLGDSTDNYVEVLDGSRVHPETYDWARKMAVDALEYDDTAEDANPAGALEEILESPERLGDLDLDAFAEELERQGFGNKNITLYDIRAELHHRYKDLRVRYEPPTVEERFNILTRETPQTFYIGKLIMCTCSGIAHKRPGGDQLDQANPVRNEESGLWQCPFCLKNDFPELSEVWSHFDAGNCPGQAVGVKTRLDNGVSGFIPTKFISDKHVTNPEERVKPGMTLHARIAKIDIERLQVDLTSKSSDLADIENKWKLQKDLYYDQDREDTDRTSEEEKRKSKARQTYIKRVIVHPSFHNIGYKECEKLVINLEQGEVIVRPSSKGSDHLTCTWKVAEGVSSHIDVIEEDKENAFSLGKKLLIGNDEFEDLDEIIARHIQPMAAFARDMVNYKYYLEGVQGLRDNIERLLKEEKKKSVQKIPYYIAACKEFPGKFLLSYMPRNKARHEFLSVTPNGIKYRNHMFRSFGSLIRWFKEHFRDPIPGTPATVRATPATVNINTPAAMDPANIQRAAAGLPNSIFNSLAQVASTNATPYNQMGVGGFYQTPMITPMMTTPSFNPMSATPQQPPQIITTPRYQPTPQTSQWAQPRSNATPRTGHTPKAGIDWANAAAMWAKQKQGAGGGGRTPRTRPSPRTPQTGPGGDSTPLIDET